MDRSIVLSAYTLAVCGYVLGIFSFIPYILDNYRSQNYANILPYAFIISGFAILTWNLGKKIQTEQADTPSAEMSNIYNSSAYIGFALCAAYYVLLIDGTLSSRPLAAIGYMFLAAKQNIGIAFLVPFYAIGIGANLYQASGKNMELVSKFALLLYLCVYGYAVFPKL